MKAKIKIKSNRISRHFRIRRRIFGTRERPRLCVFRSLKHFEAQVIDDLSQQTLVSASTRDKDFKAKGKPKSGSNVEAAKSLGLILADRAKHKGVKEVVFDRAGYLYHGRVKAFAQTVRENGLNF